MKYAIRVAGVLSIVSFAFATQGDAVKVDTGGKQELQTSTPGVTYVMNPDGDIEFHAPTDFQGVAITPDGRNLYLAN